jgi:hypothetical protein
LILRGIKTIEFRSRPTKIIGERFYIYAGQKWAEGKVLLAGCEGKSEIRNQKSEPLRGAGNPETEIQNPKLRIPVVGDNIEVAGAMPHEWMVELAQMLILKDLPTGVIVGSASIKQVIKGDSFYEWHLTDVERVKRFRKPKGQPQPVWFTPF